MKQRSIVLLMVITLTVPLWSYTYPDVHTSLPSIVREKNPIDRNSLVEFLTQWNITDESEGQEFVAQSYTIAQLESVYRIQTAQLEQLRRQARPVFSILTDPSNPLYGFTSTKTQDFSAGFPPSDVPFVSHQFGLGAAVSQQLSTAGSLDVTVRHSMSASSTNGGAYAYKQSPSVAISLQQPLGIGRSIIDFSYGRKIEEKQLLQQSSAFDTVENTREELTIQIKQLYHSRQALIESRWLLVQQALLSDEALDKAELDFNAGIVSRNQLVRQQLLLQELSQQITVLEKEIHAIENSIRTLSGKQQIESLAPEALFISVDALQRILSYVDGNLSTREDALREAIKRDSDYRLAEQELQTALIDKALGNPGDAPRLSISMRLSPYTTAGTTLWDSVDNLFSASDPTMSVSVSFIASDLARTLRKTTDKLVDEQIIQATITKEQAEDAVRTKLAQLQQEVDIAVYTLANLMQSYQLSVTDVEVEQIRANAGVSDRNSVQRAELKLYEAAFAVLQQLRSLCVLDAQITHFLGVTPS